MAIFLVTPFFIIVPMSFSDSLLLKFPPTSLSLRWYENFFETARWTDAALVSLIVALGTTLVATPVGTLAAYGIHTSRTRFANIIWAAIMAPLIVPVVLVGLGLYFTYAALGLNNSIFGLILAHSTYALPYVFLTVAGALAGYDINQARVAQSLGASPAYAFLSVTLPQLSVPIATGAFLAFLASFDEVVIALFVSGGRNQTLTKLMFTELRMSLDPTITAVSSLMLTVAIATILATRWIGRSHRPKQAA